jgi:hypothetical protein
MGLTEDGVNYFRTKYNDEELPRLEAVGRVNEKAGAAQQAAQIALSSEKTPQEILADAETAWNNS